MCSTFNHKENDFKKIKIIFKYTVKSLFIKKRASVCVLSWSGNGLAVGWKGIHILTVSKWKNTIAIEREQNGSNPLDHA